MRTGPRIIKWRWQQNRAVVGHNLKIAWNLTRVANYYRCLAAEAHRQGENTTRSEHEQCAQRFSEPGPKAGRYHGNLRPRPGAGRLLRCRRAPAAEQLPIEFAWGNTKDFWQQEQGILAYLILHGATGEVRYLAWPGKWRPSGISFSWTMIIGASSSG